MGFKLGQSIGTLFSRLSKIETKKKAENTDRDQANQELCEDENVAKDDHG